jgi:hypothetical protein
MKFQAKLDAKRQEQLNAQRQEQLNAQLTDLAQAKPIKIREDAIPMEEPKKLSDIIENWDNHGESKKFDDYEGYRS